MSLAYRVIARLDIKGENVVKGYAMEGLRIVGKPAELARRYADEGADELIFLDTVASLYGRDNLLGIVEQTSDAAFIPITVGGGVRTIDDIRRLLRAGADKVAINTAALADPDFIARAAEITGSQAIVVSVEAKRVDGGWEAYTDQGRNRSGRDAVKWALEAVELGAGEILLTAIDRDGMRRGADLELARAVHEACAVPVVISGGIGTPAHAVEAADCASAIAIGAALHYGRTTIPALKDALAASGRPVRSVSVAASQAP